MNKRIKCIMLIDDNPDDNFFHERIINKCNVAEKVIAMESGKDALAYLTSRNDNNEPCPNLIFLDINMPGMNGWDFLVEYNKLDIQLHKPILVIMLTTSDSPDDKIKAMALNVGSNFKTKPLTQLFLEEIINKYF
jgi:CheY-like chemotaxis protein